MNLAADLGPLVDLAKALGILDDSGAPDDQWLRAPGDKLSQLLSDDGQRDALVRFVDTVLGGSAAQSTGDVVWLPVVETPAPTLSLFVVLDKRSDRVIVGVGATLVTTGPDSRTTVHVPIFQVSRGDTPLSTPIAIGTAFGRVSLDAEVAIDAQPPAAGAAGLRAVRLGLAVPTDGTVPAIALTLAGLQLPGTSVPRDVTLDVEDLAELGDTVRDLLLGLLAQQASAAGGAAAAVAGMLGFTGGVVPALPLDQLAAQGPAALKTWFAGVVSSDAARAEWLGHLADLLGGGLDAGEVTATLNGVELRLGLRTTPGPDGQPLVTVSAAVRLRASGLTARAHADLLRVSLGGGGVVALPRLEIVALAGRERQADPVLLPAVAGQVGVDALRIGVALDESRRPVLVLAADGVQVGGTRYATVDLSNPDAVAEAAGTVLSQVIDDFLARLGAIGGVVGVVLGFSTPQGFPSAPKVDFADFLRDPVGAVAARWLALLGGDAAVVRAVLAPLRDALADAGVVGQEITGTGTAADPWRIPLAGPVGLLVWQPATGRLAVALGASFTMNNLGHGCTEVASTIRLVLAEVDLAGRTGAFLGGAGLGLVIRACDPPGPMSLEVGPLALAADQVELGLTWRAGAGLRLRVQVPGAALITPSGTYPLPLPEVSESGEVTFDAWEALEAPLAALASVTAAGWLTDLTTLFGWSGTVAGPRLALAELVADADAALRAWLVELVLSANPDVLARLAGLLGRLLGSRDGASGFGAVTGSGTEADPYLLPLAVGDAPTLVLWWSPGGPARREIVDVPGTVRGWRPGDPGLPSVTLADALTRQAVLHEDVADLLRGRPPVVAGLEALVARWLGTDGLVAPPAAQPAGIAAHPVPAHHIQLAGELDLASVLGTAPPGTIVHVAVDAPGSWLPPGWPAALPPDRVVDMRVSGLAPEALALPAPGTGEWYVLLGGRAACRLAAGDADGVLGQTGRLDRLVASLAGPIAVVGYGAAGHPAMRVAQQRPSVTAVVTIGTPLTPVTFAVIDSDPAGDTLRLLHRLLPISTEDEPDDGDLATGRVLVGGLMELTRLGDPSGELGLPATADAATGGLPAAFPRAGLAAHAVFGTLAEPELRRALTAIVAAGLATRATAHVAPIPELTGCHLGLRVPLNVAGTGAEITVDGHVLLELATITDAGEGLPAVTTTPRAAIRVGLGRASGWLVGGPDPGRAPGSERETELRRLSLRVDVPLSGTGADGAALVLHEVRAFELDRERWTVGPADLTDPFATTVTTVLPEVRVVLSRVAERLALPSAGPAGPLITALFRVGGLLDAAGGFLPDGVDNLLHDPLGHVRALNLAELTAALRALLLGVAPGTGPIALGPLTLTPDLAAGSIAVALTSPDGFGAVRWSATATISGAGAAFAVTLGDEQLRLELTGPQVTAAVVWGAERIPLNQADPGQLAKVLARVVPGEVVRVALEALRELDITARSVLDAALSALGLLNADNRVLLPARLLGDPRTWLVEVLGGGPTRLRADRVIELLDALRPILGVPGTAGTWTLATGVALSATTDGDRVRLALSVNSGAFADPGGGRLVLGGSVGLLIAADAPPDVAVTAFAGRAGTAVAGREAVHLGFATGQPVSLLLRPSSGPDIVLLPGGPGLGGLAQAATRLLPLVLDAIAAQTGADLAGEAGRVVAALGDALALRTGTPPKFDADRLAAWGSPAAALAAAWPTLSAAALTALAPVLQPVLQRALGAATVTVADGALRVVVQRLTVTLDPAPFAIGVLLDLPSLPGIGRARAGITLDATGLWDLAAEVGPVELDLGGVRLAPFLAVHAGAAPEGGRRVEAGLDLGGGRAVVARWLLGGAFGMLARDGVTEDQSPQAVALALVEAVLDVIGAVALASDQVKTLLDKHVGTSTVGAILEGVLLKPGAPTRQLDDDLFDLDEVLNRIKRLARNLAQATPTVDVGPLTIGLGDVDGAAGITIAVDGRFDLVKRDVVISLENDATWITPAVPAGLTIGLVDLDDLSIRPALLVGGLGIRFAGGAGPLLDTVISLDSIALHAFAKISAAEKSGGVRLQLAGLGVAVGGATGGNQIAASMLSDTSSGGQQLAPKFSPALAVQRHGTGPVLVSLTAGPGSGPWWLAIQKDFGPVYVEQIGLSVTVTQNQIERIGILLDGRVSIFGLTAAVDDLQIACVVSQSGAPWAASAWSVDLAGLAISADMGGLVLQGGLRKFSDEHGGVEYVGMLLARFAVYGLSIYGGYGRTADAQGPFSSFFAFGAVVGPIGGPPAFFVTGIGGGFGINRRLVVPADLSKFGDYPLIKALDPGASAGGDPMAEMTAVRAIFPAERGTFWFAGGLSFNSFALVDGVAVVAIQIGDGFEISILGLARMALPRPQFALVSIELALVARFSTREGVLWVQGQLTDNSWLLYPDVRLTGGFAYVLWFAGPRRGEFVVTMGGFHPDFHRDGYPQVPRLGLSWRYGPVVVKGESYFALTSEAVMAGTRVEASAEFGPAWAHVEFGADGIVYFDPFHFQVTVYASISAGITIDVWIGEITISIHIGARVLVEGPDFHAIATFEVGPVELEVEIGERQQEAERYLAWDDFVPKYLEAADPDPGTARALTAIPGQGAAPPQTPAGADRPDGTADGTPEHPFEVLVEFDITVTSTAPLARTEVGTAHQRTHPNAGLLGIAPMGRDSLTVTLRAALLTASGAVALNPVDGTRVDNAFIVTHRDTGTFPKGIWGKPKSLESRAVPSGDVIPGVEGVTLTSVARPGNRIGPYPYKRVEVRRRQPLPFVSERNARPAFLGAATDVASVIGGLGQELNPSVLLATAAEWLARGTRTRTALASYVGERATPPRLGTLTDRLASAELPTPNLQVLIPPTRPPIDGRVHHPRAIAILADHLARLDLAAPRTTVSRPPQLALRIAAPSLALVSATVDSAIAGRLVLVSPASVRANDTLIAAGAVPATGLARSGAEASSALGAAYDGVTRLAAMTSALAPAVTATEDEPGEQVRVGEVAVLRLPNAEADLFENRRPTLVVNGADARVVALSSGGGVLLDTTTPASGAELTVPQAVERIAVAAVGTPAAGAAVPGLAGWHSGQSLPYIGWSSALGAGVVVSSEGRVSHRDVAPVPTGWVQAAELVAGATLVETRFAAPVSVMVIAVDDPSGVVTEGRALQFGLTGAKRRTDVPVSLVTGGRTFLLYEVDSAGPVTVTVASDAGWRLAGVLGAVGSVADISGRLARGGLDTAVAPLILGTTGSLRLGWLGVPDDDPGTNPA